jgi:tetratricopeptide (TPR) repeat protein
MAIKGSLREASLTDVLQLLAMGQKTGCLSVTHRSNFGSIYFDKGRICYATIVNRRDRLGDILVKSGRLQQEQLEEAIALQARQPDMRLGDLLVSHGMLSREALHDQIRVQIEEAVYFLFTWTQGTFNFEADVRPDQQDFLVSISPDALLLEGARRVDEWSLIEKKLPSFDLVFDVDRPRLEASAAALTAEQQTLVRLIDGRRDVHQLVEESGLIEFEVGKAVYGLLTAGFLHRVGQTRPTAAVVPDSRVDEHRNLGVAFYRTGMLDEATREFRRVLELKAADEVARFHIGLVLLRQGKWADAANAFHEAASSRAASGAVFHNLAYALERMGRLDEAKAALEEAQARGLADDPRVATSLGCVLLRAGDLAGADRVLSAARAQFAPRVPTGPWYHAAALVAALVGDLERASGILEEGIATYPHAAALFNNRAVVLERRGDRDGALAVAERGVQEDPGLPQLHKNVGDAHYRAGRPDEALAAYQRAVKLHPTLGVDVHLKIGNIRFKRQERAEAILAWERAEAMDPSNTIVRTNLEAARRMA